MEYGYFMVAQSDYNKDSSNRTVIKMSAGFGVTRNNAIKELEKGLHQRVPGSKKPYKILEEGKFGNWPTGLATGKPGE